MKVLLSAYACEPWKGSEPGVGLQTAVAAARQHDVWVLTRENNLPALRTYLADHPLRERMELVGLDVGGRALRWKKRSTLASHLYYDQWQRAAAAQALELDARVDFDLIHHVTFAAYWKRAGVAVVAKPFVWGPIGGGVRSPWRLALHLGVRGWIEEAARTIVRPLAAQAPAIRLAQRRASVTLVQNPDTSGRIRSTQPPIVLPNALGAQVPASALASERRCTVVVVSALIPWKGVDLALDAFAAARVPGSRLLVIGDGPQRRRLLARTETLGLRQHVEFLGDRPRDEVLGLVGASRLLLHPALHEEAGWAVAEALSLGTPVVCLARGGPPELLRQWPDTPSLAIRSSTRRRTVDALAGSVRRFLQHDRVVSTIHRPSRSYDDVLLTAYEAAARQPVAGNG